MSTSPKVAYVVNVTGYVAAHWGELANLRRGTYVAEHRVRKPYKTRLSASNRSRYMAIALKPRLSSDSGINLFRHARNYTTEALLKR